MTFKTTNRAKALLAFKNCYTVRRLLLDEQFNYFNVLRSVRDCLLFAFSAVCNTLKSLNCQSVRSVYKEVHGWPLQLAMHFNCFYTTRKYTVFNNLVNGSLDGFFKLLRHPSRCDFLHILSAPRWNMEGMVGSFSPKKHPYMHPGAKYRLKHIPALKRCQIIYLKPKF